ncbi:class II aldolase/adducin family protein, partial [Streptomyces hundungensis]|uniref:class II aldolase/adducin family protein n=1 Tax=Streptomyces hundungensis TaxID=1077946 RepID=UPI0033E51CD4
MSDDEAAIAAAWAELIDTARRTAAEGLVVGTSGNVSVRVGDLVLVTPTGVPYDRLGPADTGGARPTERTVHTRQAPEAAAPAHRSPRHA